MDKKEFEIRFPLNCSWIISLLLVFLIMLIAPMPVHAKTTASTVKKAYVSYLKEQIKNEEFAEDISYYLYDFNKDGIKELIVENVGAARAYYYLYTYRNKKVIKLNAEGNQVGYIKGKKYIVVSSSGGAAYDYQVMYKISNGKLKKISEYSYEDGICKKNGKKISDDAYMKFFKKINYNIGKRYSISGE